MRRRDEAYLSAEVVGVHVYKRCKVGNGLDFERLCEDYVGKLTLQQ